LTAAVLAFCALGAPDPAAAQSASPQESAVPRAGEPAPQGVLTKAPELQQFVEAVRPPGAETQVADVILLLTVNVDGSVGDVIVQSGTGGGLDQAAVEAARRFRFTPAEVDGKPAPVQLVYKYAFTLDTQTQTVAAPVDAARPVGVLKGTIVERGTRKPLPGIAVKLLEPAIEVYTDADGRFVIPDVPAGKVVVRIDDASYYTIEDREAVEPGQATDVKYYLEKATSTDELVVVGRRVKKDVARQTLTLTEIRKIPGASGDAL
jgi:TonB family protein